MDENCKCRGEYRMEAVADAGGLCYNCRRNNPINETAPEGACNTNGSLTTMKGHAYHGS